ncbi:unnamed protein product [Trichobilharzia regenti]|nr:unnamed protein product [Trichobilharzia regenti]
MLGFSGPLSRLVTKQTDSSGPNEDPIAISSFRLQMVSSNVHLNNNSVKYAVGIPILRWLSSIYLHTEQTVSNKVAETKDGSIPEQTISNQSSPAKSATFQDHKHHTDQDSYGILKNRAKIKANRITGLRTNFITEILFALYPVLFTQQSNVAYEAVKSIEVRATYELWTNVMLLVDSMKQDYERSKLPAPKSIKHYNQVVNEEEVEAGKTVFNEMSNDDNKLDSEQLCLASAYCGLWSGLLCKRSDMSQEETLQDLPEFEDLSGKRLHYVRLAQAKFKRPVVTNSNFRI